MNKPDEDPKVPEPEQQIPLSDTSVPQPEEPVHDIPPDIPDPSIDQANNDPLNTESSSPIKMALAPALESQEDLLSWPSTPPKKNILRDKK